MVLVSRLWKSAGEADGVDADPTIGHNLVTLKIGCLVELLFGPLFGDIVALKKRMICGAFLW